MTSTKVMLLGILIILLGLALNSAATFVNVRVLGAEAPVTLASITAALFAIGFIVGIVGFFRR